MRGSNVASGYDDTAPLIWLVIVCDSGAAFHRQFDLHTNLVGVRLTFHRYRVYGCDHAQIGHGSAQFRVDYFAESLIDARFDGALVGHGSSFSRVPD